MSRFCATRIRLLLCVATGGLLLACSAAAWALPRPSEGADPQTASASNPTTAGFPAGEDRCDFVRGAARDYCLAPAVENTEPVAASSSPVREGQARWLLLFSTAALTAAIGLAVMADRPSR